MKRKTIIKHEQPIALYNTEKQELMAVFVSPSLAARYIYDVFKQRHTNHVCWALQTKGKIGNSRFEIKICFRYANDEQKKLLEGDDFIIVNGYPEVLDIKMKGYSSTRIQLAEQHTGEHRKIAARKNII